MMERLAKLIERPYGPYIVLATAILLPGAGHVLVGRPRRGLVMQMFIILLAMATWHLTTPDQSLVGRLAGGLFIYALSIPEAYRFARLRAAQAMMQSTPASPAKASRNSVACTSRLSF